MRTTYFLIDYYTKSTSKICTSELCKITLDECYTKALKACESATMAIGRAEKARKTSVAAATSDRLKQHCIVGAHN